MNYSFKILGLKVLKGCASGMRKVLDEDETYLFDTDYEKDYTNVYNLRLSNTPNSIAERMYLAVGKDNQPVQINIQAIVGKNGDGKSTIIELMLRVLNNFACYFGFAYDHDTLCPIKDLCAILYFEADSKVYAIKSDKDSKISVYKNGVELNIINGAESDADKKNSLKATLGDSLFYTLIVNYSLYAYNSEVLDKETDGGSWIDALFHKNDSYQTPVVLNPMRTKGNIDINREEDLSRQRLMALYTASGGLLDACKISDTQTAEGFAFSLETESKLVTHTIRKFFRDVKPYKLPNVGIEQIREHISDDDKKYLLQHGADNMCIHFTEFWESFMTWYSQMPFLEKLLGEDQHYYEYNHKEKSDLNEYLDIYHSLIKRLNIPDADNVLRSIEYFRKSKTDWMTYAQLYRLLVIKTVWETLGEQKSWNVEGSLDEAIGKRHDAKYAAMLYMVYKVIDILQTYKPYTDSDHVTDRSYNIFANPISNSIELKALRRDVLSVLERTDYTTLKLRQTNNYLRRRGKANSPIKYLHLLTHKKVLIDSSEIDYKDKDYDRYLTFNDLRQSLGGMLTPISLTDIMDQLPPPIFKGDIIVADRKGERYPMSSLSSGQIQMIYSVSSIAYHLRNLDFKLSGNSIQYRNVNIICEEVELYFHPEYQREYVTRLHDQIKHCNLENIKCINICLVTHSPFVLSDVLRKNTLYLRSGHQQIDRTNETFGANLYDLMQDSFFLEKNAMGVRSSMYYQRLICKKNAGEEIRDEELALVGDSLVRSYLET